MYQPIDQIATGRKIKTMLESVGYDVKYIQEYLHLSCPQSIYRWYKGKALPSLEHLAALSKLLCVHMEELLVFQEDVHWQSNVSITETIQRKHLLTYTMYLKKIA